MSVKYGRRTVRIYVGQEEQIHDIHEELICEKSSFF
jgi:hypothetical protein